jgi:hypothetical protein
MQFWQAVGGMFMWSGHYLGKRGCCVIQLLTLYYSCGQREHASMFPDSSYKAFAIYSNIE